MPSSLPHLLVRDPAGHDREVEITHTPFTMGRQSDNDLVLLDSRISRHHAKIFVEDGGHLIEDTGSRHGTFVNSERITRCLLKSGDYVSLGVTDSYQLTFVEERVAPVLDFAFLHAVDLAVNLEQRSGVGRLEILAAGRSRKAG